MAPGPKATGGPSWATVLAAVLGALITLVLRTHTAALVTLFTASTIMPAILYASTVLLLGAPHWRPDARGAFLGLGLVPPAGTWRGWWWRASPPRSRCSPAPVAADCGAPLTTLRADGGLTRSRLLVQAQADLLQAPVEVSRSPHATALGAAALARLGLGEIADLAEAAGPAEVEWVAESAITPEEAAKRLAGFDSAQRRLLARRGPALS